MPETSYACFICTLSPGVDEGILESKENFFHHVYFITSLHYIFKVSFKTFMQETCLYISQSSFSRIVLEKHGRFSLIYDVN